MRLNQQRPQHCLLKYSDWVPKQTNFYGQHGPVGRFPKGPIRVLATGASDADRANTRGIHIKGPSSRGHLEAAARHKAPRNEAHARRSTYGKDMHM